MPPKFRVGLTGGIASGKSTVAGRFAELGVPVIDADESSRTVVVPGSAGLLEIKSQFGADVLSPAGELDRRALRAMVFADPKRRRELESILHPLIQADMEKRALASTGPYLIMVIPLLIEGRGADRFQRVLVVDVEEAVQLQRLMVRDRGTLEQARAILQVQASRASRLRAADDVLVNSGSVAELRQAVDEQHRRYLRLAEASDDSKTHIA
jgi:dephospho-CoA kinase